MTSIHTKLKELRELRERATPGPWKILFKGADLYVGNWDIEQKEIRSGPDGVHVDNYNSPSVGQAYPEDTARFIAHAANKWLTILTALEKAVESLGYYSGNFDGKEGTQWIEDTFFFQDKFGATSTAAGPTYAKEALDEIAAMLEGK